MLHANSNGAAPRAHKGLSENQNGTAEFDVGSRTAQPTSGAQREAPWLDGVRLAGCVAGGVLFGFAAEKCRVFVPSVIYNQMLFSQLTMLKTFLSAVFAGVGTFAVLAVIPATRPLFQSIRKAYSSSLSNKRWSAMAVGGIILGMGMTISGACPGMVFLQVGAGTSNALYTLAGCYLGALLYGTLEPLLQPIAYRKEPLDSHSYWLDRSLGVPYVGLATGLAAAVGVVIATTEYFVPWNTDVPVSPPDVGVLAQISWSPVLSGVIMGSLQLCSALLVRHSLGGSSSYCTVVANGLKRLGGIRTSYFNGFLGGLMTWWQLAFWLGAAGGAASSAYLAGTWGSTVGVAPWMGILGGVFMLFGARLASGCTSGHGLSGLALLSAPSFLTVPAIFAGGIGLAVTITILT